MLSLLLSFDIFIWHFPQYIAKWDAIYVQSNLIIQLLHILLMNTELANRVSLCPQTNIRTWNLEHEFHSCSPNWRFILHSGKMCSTLNYHGNQISKMEFLFIFLDCWYVRSIGAHAWQTCLKHMRLLSVDQVALVYEIVIWVPPPPLAKGLCKLCVMLVRYVSYSETRS